MVKKHPLKQRIASTGKRAKLAFVDTVAWAKKTFPDVRRLRKTKFVRLSNIV